jgi:hypothetical protein
MKNKDKKLNSVINNKVKKIAGIELKKRVHSLTNTI